MRPIVDWLGLGAVFGAMMWLLSIAGCPRWSPPDDPPKPVAACEAACARLVELGCDAGQPTPEGTTCVQVCEDTERTGWTTMHPDCVAEAASCEEAERVSGEGCAR